VFRCEKLQVEVDSDDEKELLAKVDEKQAEHLEKQGFWMRTKKAVGSKVATSK
jgi:hypothetical protein